MARRSGQRRPGSGDGSTTAGAGASEKAAGWTTLAVGLFVSLFLLWRNGGLNAAFLKFRFPRPFLAPPTGFDEYNLLNAAMLLWLPLCVILLVLRREPADWGFTVGDIGKGLLVALLLFLPFIPVLLIFSNGADAQSYYLSWMAQSRAVGGIFYTAGKGYTGGSIAWQRLLYHETVMGFYMFAWEWFFRGFLLFGLKRVMPVAVAVLVQAVLFTALHWGKPLPELISSFFGAVLMAVLALRYKSFLPCFVLHFLVSAGFDFAVLFHHFRR